LNVSVSLTPAPPQTGPLLLDNSKWITYTYGTGVPLTVLSPTSWRWTYPPTGVTPNTGNGTDLVTPLSYSFNDLTFNAQFYAGGIANSSAGAIFGDEMVVFCTNTTTWSEKHWEMGVRFGVNDNIVYGYVEDDFAGTFDQVPLLSPNDGGTHSYGISTSGAAASFQIDSVTKGSLSISGGATWSQHPQAILAVVHRVENFPGTGYYMEMNTPIINVT
jgi:hypothetical protein